jgi:hypothetical protein
MADNSEGPAGETQEPGYVPEPGYAPGPGYAPPGYGPAAGYGPAPGYAPAPGYPAGPGYVPAVRPTNSLAIAALVCGIGQAVLWLPAGIAAVVLGHMARGQIRRTGENGSGMALAGLILGYIGIGLTIIGIILVVILIVAVHRQAVIDPSSPFFSPRP